MDDNLARAVRKVFVQLYNEGLIYKGKYIVNWCPRCHTALADDEVDHVDSKGSLWHVRYDFADGSGSVTIATTRPETILGDSAVCVNPTPEELASIAIASSETVAALTGWDVRCALLSHSTDGSMDNELVDKVRAARDIANERRPDLKIDGEFQFDAAINPKVAAKKVHHDSEVAGRANLLIWPDINVGNIGVKIIQNLTGADAYGPMLQGFKKIVCDCSRSAPVSEIVGNVVMSCVRAQALEG